MDGFYVPNKIFKKSARISSTVSMSLSKTNSPPSKCISFLNLEIAMFSMKAGPWSRPLKTSIRTIRSKRYKIGVGTPMTENFMIHRSPIFASYHSNFWLMKILIISIRGPSLRLEVNSKPCRACFPRLLIFLI